MLRVIWILSTCLLTTVCFGQEQLRYYNSKEHFSFELPRRWDYIPVEDLPVDIRESIDNFFPKGGALAICQKVGNKYLEPPYILVQGGSTREVSETLFDKMWRSKEGRDSFLRKKEETIRCIQNAEGYLPKSWKGAKLVEKEIEYDTNRHISFETLEFYHDSVGKIIVATVRALGSHRLAVLRFYLEGDDAENFWDLVEEVSESLKYDEGYGFGETKGVAPGLTQKLLGNTWQSWLLWAVGVIVVSWLIRRWVAG